MFTGLIEQMGSVASIELDPSGAKLVIDPRGWNHSPEHGQSIAVNGCCLTVANHVPSGAQHELEFDVITQTLDKTAIGTLVRGDHVNLEHAATASTLLGGHIVQGHVDGVGLISHVKKDVGEWRVRIEPPPPLMEFLVDQGSIAVDGVSLTIAATGANWFEVALIPTTLRLTTLGRAAAGQRVNLEIDCIAKTVVSWLRKMRRNPMAE